MTARESFRSATDDGPRHGVARALSRLGAGSRTQAAAWVRSGRVSVNGRVVRDPEHPARAGDAIALDGRRVTAAAPVHLALNKPRGLVTTAADEHGRDTVYRCFEGATLPWIAPVGRLDRASEGLLLFSNDPAWAARITDGGGVVKRYHVQVDAPLAPDWPARLRERVHDRGESLRALDARWLRSGGRTSWLAIDLDEGRNRHIRRLLAAHDLRVLRLVRTAIGGVALGDLAKGAWRAIDPHAPFAPLASEERAAD